MARTWKGTVASLAPRSHTERVKEELQALGVSRFGLMRMESRYLPNIIHPNETIGGVVYGSHEDGSVMIVATDRRIIFLDKKPLFVNEDEMSYAMVGGISMSHAGWGTVVTLHTRLKDYKLRTYNRKCAQGFMRYLEMRSLEGNQSDIKYFQY